MPEFWLTGGKGKGKAAANVCLALCKLRESVFLLVHFVAKGHDHLNLPKRPGKVCGACGWEPEVPAFKCRRQTVGKCISYLSGNNFTDVLKIK